MRKKIILISTIVLGACNAPKTIVSTNNLQNTLFIDHTHRMHYNAEQKIIYIDRPFKGEFKIHNTTFHNLKLRHSINHIWLTPDIGNIIALDSQKRWIQLVPKEDIDTCMQAWATSEGLLFSTSARIGLIYYISDKTLSIKKIPYDKNPRPSVGTWGAAFFDTHRRLAIFKPSSESIEYPLEQHWETISDSLKETPHESTKDASKRIHKILGSNDSHIFFLAEVFDQNFLYIVRSSDGYLEKFRWNYQFGSGEHHLITKDSLWMITQQEKGARITHWTENKVTEGPNIYWDPGTTHLWEDEGYLIMAHTKRNAEHYYVTVYGIDGTSITHFNEVKINAPMNSSGESCAYVDGTFFYSDHSGNLKNIPIEIPPKLQPNH